MTTSTNKSPPPLGLRVVCNTFDTLSHGRASNPIKDASGQVAEFLNSQTLSTSWKLQDELSVRILENVLGERLPNTSAVLKSVLHRLVWFRAIGELVLQFRRECPILDSQLAESLIDNLKRTRNWQIPSVIKWIKYYQLALHVRFLYPGDYQKELPEKPPGFGPEHPEFRLMSGCLGRWIGYKLVSVKSRDSQRFFYSWFQTKRGCRVMDDDDILETFQKHAKALQGKPSPVPDDCLDFYQGKCAWLFQKFVVSEPDDVDFELSHNSSVSHTRRAGGTLSAVQLELSRLPRHWSKEACLRLFDRVFHTEEVAPSDVDLPAVYIPDILLAFVGFEEDDSVEYTEMCHSSVAVRDWDGKERSEKALPKIDYRVLRDLALCSMGDLCTERSDIPRAIVAPVLEPLKVRLVTKGNPLVYAASMPLQKSMHTFLKRKSVFRLIGEPLTSEHVLELEDCHVTKFFQKSEDFFWKSGDFSAATDTLKIEVTKLIFETWLNSVHDVDMRSIGRYALYEHEISYPKLRGKIVPEPFMQTTGQLMGSTLSFPVLCVANLLAYWRALERYQSEVNFMAGVPPPKSYKGDLNCFVWKRVPFSYLAVRINGDDIVFPSNRAFEKIWREEISQMGFSESEGKSISHPKLLYLNSKQYRHNGPRQWEELPFFNVGVLLAQEKIVKLCPKTLKVEEGSPADLSSLSRSLLEGSLRCDAAMARFVEIHQKEIRRQTKDGLFNLFASRYLSGLNFAIPSPDWQFSWTRVQRRLGRMRMDRYLYKVCARAPRILGFEPNHRFANPNLVPRGETLLVRDGDEAGYWEFMESKNFEYAPDLELEIDIAQNRDYDRYMHYLRKEELTEEEQGYSFKKPRSSEIQALYKARIWRDDMLASDEEMKRALRVLNVVRIEVPEVHGFTHEL